ncbi:MAG: CoA-binding protein [Bacteriovoracia bacterium]
MEVVVVLGASSNPERYSNMAIRELRSRGHRVIPVHPQESMIEGLPVVANLQGLSGQPIDTLTLYLRPELSAPLAAAIVALKPRRVIFNPGTESHALEKILTQNNIEVLEACTLVMLRTGQF